MWETVEVVIDPWTDSDAVQFEKIRQGTAQLLWQGPMSLTKASRLTAPGVYILEKRGQPVKVGAAPRGRGGLGGRTKGYMQWGGYLDAPRSDYKLRVATLAPGSTLSIDDVERTLARFVKKTYKKKTGRPTRVDKRRGSPTDPISVGRAGIGISSRGAGGSVPRYVGRHISIQGSPTRRKIKYEISPVRASAFPATSGGLPIASFRLTGRSRTTRDFHVPGRHVRVAARTRCTSRGYSSVDALYSVTLWEVRQPHMRDVNHGTVSYPLPGTASYTWSTIPPGRYYLEVHFPARDLGCLVDGRLEVSA